MYVEIYVLVGDHFLKSLFSVEGFKSRVRNKITMLQYKEHGKLQTNFNKKSGFQRNYFKKCNQRHYFLSIYTGFMNCPCVIHRLGTVVTLLIKMCFLHTTLDFPD
jgi:hypothetical protein